MAVYIEGMNKKISLSSSQAGIAHIALVLVLIIVVVVGYAGWTTYQNTQKNDYKPAPAAKTSNATTLNNDQSDTKYLAIKEWGIKVALTSDTFDAYYDSKVTTDMEARSLRVHSLDSESDCANGSQSIATIFKVPKDAENESIAGKTYAQTQDGVVVGDSFYFIAGSQYNCTDDTDKQVTLQKVRNDFITASPTIQKL